MLDGIEASGIGGNARVEVNGQQDALAIRLSAGLRNLAGADARITGAALLDLPAKQVALNSLAVDWHDEPVRLLAPARISFGGRARGGPAAPRDRPARRSTSPAASPRGSTSPPRRAT